MIHDINHSLQDGKHPTTSGAPQPAQNLEELQRSTDRLASFVVEADKKEVPNYALHLHLQS